MKLGHNCILQEMATTSNKFVSWKCVAVMMLLMQCYELDLAERSVGRRWWGIWFDYLRTCGKLWRFHTSHWIHRFIGAGFLESECDNGETTQIYNRYVFLSPIIVYVCIGRQFCWWKFDATVARTQPEHETLLITIYVQHFTKQVWNEISW